jgi:hypothetical protein
MSLGWIVNAFCKMYKVSFFGCWFAAKKTLPLKENISSPIIFFFECACNISAMIRN